MNLKAPLMLKDQIEKLKKHGMLIEDEEEAMAILSQINYYRFTGYTLQYRIQESQSDYAKEISFRQVFKIYQFDESLRHLLRKYIEKIEIFYKTQISYGFSMAKCTIPPYDQHYDQNHFYDKRGYHEVMDSFKKEENYYRDSLIVKHHKQKYENKMPLWVIVELMSFSNTSKLYSSMYVSEKKRIASAVGGISEATLENHLHCLSVLRNKCAHAARLYNTKFNPPARFTSQFLRKNPDVKNNSLFAYILVLIKRLPNDIWKKSFLHDLFIVLEEYGEGIDFSLIGFPKNYIDLLNSSMFLMV